MAYISYNKLWESGIDNFVSKKDHAQDISLNHLKLKVNYAFKNDEKITTNFEPTDNSDIFNKA